MDRDPIDLFIEQWERERPDLEPASLGVVSRVLMLAKHLEQAADRALATYGLTLWQFDVLAALRRSGTPFKLSPTNLMELVTLTSGAMTNRIDRLEAMGLVVREADPNDRRGLLIALTPKGRKLADEAIGARLDESAKNVAAALSTREAETVATLLRKLLISNLTGSRTHRRAARTAAGRNAQNK